MIDIRLWVGIASGLLVVGLYGIYATIIPLYQGFVINTYSGFVSLTWTHYLTLMEKIEYATALVGSVLAIIGAIAIFYLKLYHSQIPIKRKRRRQI